MMTRRMKNMKPANAQSPPITGPKAEENKHRELCFYQLKLCQDSILPLKVSLV